LRFFTTLSACGAGSQSAEVALDLVLNEIVQRAHTATKSAAAGIALARAGEFVCRARIGETVPDLGVSLNRQSRLSAACISSKRWQRCDDTEADSRVDAKVCRHLGVRSILAVPVHNDNELLGVIEVFSPSPNAFDDRDLEVLQSLSREVVENVERAAGMSDPRPDRHFVREVVESRPPHPSDPMQSMAVAEEKSSVVKRQFGTNTLFVLVIGLSLIVGWMVGRSGWRGATVKPVKPGIQAAHGNVALPEAGVAATTDQQSANQSAGVSSGLDATDTQADSGQGLVVYRNGKVVFRVPQASTRQTKRLTLADARPPAEKSLAGSPPLRISPEIAEEYITKRVEPEYPKQARTQGIQGPVVLDAWVGKDGSVQMVTTISGNAQLVAAARNAVGQWKFQPFFHEGQPQEFQTRVTVVFSLP
jgi:TonB family protein